MTTQQIRRNIRITYFHITIDTLCISYEYHNKSYDLIITPDKALPLLKSALVIDDYAHVHHILQAKIDDKVLFWEDFVKKYKLNQYDCIEIITRLIMEKELETDTSMLEIDEALKALQNV